jgi:hypothetical protein
MSRPDSPQLNIRSSFARERAGELARSTGLTTTQIVEDALRAYLPPSRGAPHSKLVRKGALLVRPRRGREISLDDANAALDETRSEQR